MKSILLIEDSPVLLENTAEILTLANYKVFSTANSKEGIGIAIRKRLDLIIIDMKMADIEGHELLKAIRCSQGMGKTPMIFLAETTEKSCTKQDLVGFDDALLAKPFDGDQLLHAVGRYLQN